MIIRPPVSALRWTTFGSITVERGCGEPLALRHGNGSMIQDFESSGLVELAATIIGSSFLTVLASAQRPAAQRHLDARLPGSIDQARTGAARRFTRHRPGHSGGASVAVVLALKFPDLARGLVLASGYY